MPFDHKIFCVSHSFEPLGSHNAQSFDFRKHLSVYRILDQTTVVFSVNFFVVVGCLLVVPTKNFANLTRFNRSIFGGLPFQPNSLINIQCKRNDFVMSPLLQWQTDCMSALTLKNIGRLFVFVFFYFDLLFSICT